MPDSGQDIVNILSKLRESLMAETEALRTFGRRAAIADRNYRLAFRKEVFRLHEEDGVAWTACSDLARGQEDDGDQQGCANLRLNRDIAVTEKEVAQERINCMKIEIRLLESEVNEALGRGRR